MLTTEQILQLVAIRGALALKRGWGRSGTPPRQHKKVHDRKDGPTPGVHSIHNLRHAVNHGFRYAA